MTIGFCGLLQKTVVRIAIAETAGAGQAGVREAFVFIRARGQVVFAITDGSELHRLEILISGVAKDLFA